jgi:UDPglucose 6-dehydrogenase
MSSRDGPVKPVGVVGLGNVGGTVAQAFERVPLPVRTFDRYQGVGSPEELAPCEVVFVCVPTPLGPDGRHDATELWAAVRDVEPHLEDRAVVAVKSTVGPGTTEALAADFPRLHFVSAPEFLVQNRPMDTFTHPDRIVIGSRSEDAAARVTELVRLVAPEAPVVLVKPTEAELAKLCSNAMLAAKVTLANDLFDVCRAFGVEWSSIQEAVGMDHRIGPGHLRVNDERGFGGACLPKDLDGLIAASREAGNDPSILAEIARFNRRIRGDGVVEVRPSSEEL